MIILLSYIAFALFDHLYSFRENYEYLLSDAILGVIPCRKGHFGWIQYVPGNCKPIFYQCVLLHDKTSRKQAKQYLSV